MKVEIYKDNVLQTFKVVKAFEVDTFIAHSFVEFAAESGAIEAHVYALPYTPANFFPRPKDWILLDIIRMENARKF